MQVFGENFRKEFAAVTQFFIGGFRLLLENVPCGLLDSKFEQGWNLQPGLILRKSYDLRVVLLEGAAPYSPPELGPSIFRSGIWGEGSFCLRAVLLCGKAAKSAFISLVIYMCFPLEWKDWYSLWPSGFVELEVNLLSKSLVRLVLKEALPDLLWHNMISEFSHLRICF